MNHLYKILELFIYLEEIDISGTYDPKHNFCAILCILLDGHLVQFRIKFDNHVEIHLTYRKNKSVSKILKLLQDILYVVYYM